MARKRQPLCPILPPLASILVLLVLSGCTPVGAIAGKVVGPPPVKARYVPPKDRPMLVLVENYRNPSAAALDARNLSLRIEEELRRHRIAPVVDAEQLETVRSTADYPKMSIPAVGRATGAQQILYVNVATFTVENTVANEMLRGRTEMTVRVVDAATGATRWPTDTPTGHPVTIETPWLRQGRDVTEPGLRDQMSRQAANYIVKLFRKHDRDEAAPGDE